jgi:hypothetical protein
MYNCTCIYILLEFVFGTNLILTHYTTSYNIIEESLNSDDQQSVSTKQTTTSHLSRGDMFNILILSHQTP